MDFGKESDLLMSIHGCHFHLIDAIDFDGIYRFAMDGIPENKTLRLSVAYELYHFSAGNNVLNNIGQGLVNVPFWEYWTSPYSSHYRPYT